MPDTAPLPADWGAIEAHAVTHGVREAARAYGMNENTVMARARRYGWIARIREAQVHAPALPASMLARPDARTARKPADAARSTLEKYGATGKLALAKTVRKASVHLSRQKPAELVERVPAILGLASAHAKLFPEQNQANSLVQINFASVLPDWVRPCGTGPAPALPQAPVEEE